MTSPDPGHAAAAVAWLSGGLRGFGRSVTSVVPAGFPAYARLLHPAYRAGRPVRWAEVAAAYGRRTSPSMQFCALVGHHGGAGRAGVYDEPPRTGALPPEYARAVVPTLASHTTTPERCWFAIWDGWSGLPESVTGAPTLATPYRRYYLRTGPVDAPLAWEHPVNLWWPDDRAWCLASEVDLDSTYLGGSRACVARLVAMREVECLPAEPSDGITFDSDPYNPAPPH